MKTSLKKVTAFLLVSVLGVAALSGCNEKKQATNSSAPETKTIVMGTNAAFPPFEFTTSQGLVGQFDGVDVAISKKIAESMGCELKIEDMEFEGLVASVASGKVDFAAAGMTVNEERKEQVDFSDPYYVAAQTMVVAADNTTIKSAADLQNVNKVGVVLGYTGDTVVTETLQVPESKINRVSRGIDAVQNVKNGRLDAVVIDSVTGKALAEKNGLKTVDDPEAFESEEYAIAVAKGNSELLEKINSVLKEMKESGEIDKLVQKYNEEGAGSAE